jgi:hypothetical protein
MKLKKYGLKADTSAMVTFRGIIISLLIIVVASSLFLSFWLQPSDVCTNCPEGDIVLLDGRLRGFNENQSSGRFDVFLGNESYTFDIFDVDYMQKMIGFNCTIKACYRTDQSNSISYYDFMNAWIIEE